MKKQFTSNLDVTFLLGNKTFSSTLCRSITCVWAYLYLLSRYLDEQYK